MTPWIYGLVALNVIVWGTVLLRFRRRRRIWLGAFLEQGRVEHAHRLPFRHDQKVHALQQRLARHLGKRYAFSAKVKKKIEAEVRRADAEGWD